MRKIGRTPGVERNYAIDALRFIAICFVVYIHIFAINQGVVFTESVSSKIIDLLFGVSRLAVPIFFAISGWFIYSINREDQIEKLRRQIPRLVKILLVATIGTGTVLWLMAQLHLVERPFDYFPGVKGLFDMVALGNSPTIAPLWFLVSLIIVEALFLIVSYKCKGITWLIIPATLFFCANIAFGSYRTVTGLPELPISINETWFLGFAWFSLGYFLSYYFKNDLVTIKKRNLVWFTAIAGALYLYEYILHTSGAPLVFGPYNYDAVFILTPVVTAGILLLAAKTTADQPIIKNLANLGKNYALGVFIIHLVVMQPINALFIHLHLLESHPVVKLAVIYTSVIVISCASTAFYYRVKLRLFAR